MKNQIPLKPLQLIVFSVSFVVLFSTSSFGFSDQQWVKSIKSNTQAKYSVLYSTLNTFKNEIESPRRQFETIQNYERRIDEAEDKLKQYTKNTYSMTIPSDNIELNWENSAIIVTFEFPNNILKPRSDHSSTNIMKIIVSKSAAKIRELYTFRDSIQGNIVFRFTKKGQTLIVATNLTYRGTTFYEI